MKIAFLASTFLPTIGGAEVLMHNLAIHLQKMGHEVHVITWWGNWIQVRGKLPYPVHPLLPRSHTEADRHLLDEHGTVGTWVARQVLFYQRLYSFDVFQIHNAYPLGPLCVKALACAQIPLVMRCTGGDLLYDQSMCYGLRCNPILGKAVVDSILTCDHVTASSRLMEDGYRSVGVPSEKITRIPNGVDVDGISRVESPGAALRQANGIPADAPLLLTVGRHVNFKGFRYIPQILRRLLDADCQVWWVVVGAETDSLRSISGVDQMSGRLVTIPTLPMAAGRDWSDRLPHLPPDSLVQWYKTANLYIHPAILEPFGNIVVEAMAAGLPLVVTDGTGAADCVVEARCGWIAKRGDVRDMAENIRRLLADKPQRMQMAVRAKAGAGAYDWSHIAKRYEAVYRDAIVSPRGQGTI